MEDLLFPSTEPLRAATQINHILTMAAICLFLDFALCIPLELSTWEAGGGSFKKVFHKLCVGWEGGHMKILIYIAQSYFRTSGLSDKKGSLT